MVLSTGFRVSDDLRQTARSLGIELNAHGFAQTGDFDPVATSRSGVYVCGMFEGPKDIPETMIQASAAACRASAHVPASAAVSESDSEFIPERDVTGEEPRVGVFICDCGENIGGVIDIPQLAAFAAKLPGVAIAEGVGHGCSRESMKHIEEAIESHKLNRVVIGGCSPRTHETRFQDLLRRCGLNKYLVEIANLRDQDTWVHLDHPKDAGAKARQLIWASVLSVKKARSLADNQLPINRDILVVGGGVAGMSASLRLADQGFKVFLAERHSMLGRRGQSRPQNPGRRGCPGFCSGPDSKNALPCQYPGNTQRLYRGSQRHAGHVQNRHAGRTPDVLSANQSRRDDSGNRRTAQPSGRVSARPACGGDDPAGCGCAAGGFAGPGLQLEQCGHDPVCGLPAAG